MALTGGFDGAMLVLAILCFIIDIILALVVSPAHRFWYAFLPAGLMFWALAVFVHG